MTKESRPIRTETPVKKKRKRKNTVQWFDFKENDKLWNFIRKTSHIYFCDNILMHKISKI